MFIINDDGIAPLGTPDGTDGSLSGAIDGQLGTDTLSYRPSLIDVTVDLPGGTATNVAGGLVAGTGGATDGNSIENVYGGSGNDDITGDQDSNVLEDGLGDDTL